MLVLARAFVAHSDGFSLRVEVDIHIDRAIALIEEVERFEGQVDGLGCEAQVARAISAAIRMIGEDSEKREAGDGRGQERHGSDPTAIVPVAVHAWREHARGELAGATRAYRDAPH